MPGRRITPARFIQPIWSRTSDTATSMEKCCDHPYEGIWGCPCPCHLPDDDDCCNCTTRDEAHNCMCACHLEFAQTRSQIDNVIDAAVAAELANEAMERRKKARREGKVIL